jgi:tetratricopeptide (TPR) repeat protein
LLGAVVLAGLGVRADSLKPTADRSAHEPAGLPEWTPSSLLATNTAKPRAEALESELARGTGPPNFQAWPIDPALRESGALLNSSNLVEGLHADPPPQRLAALQLRLETARRLRRENLLDQAETALTDLMERGQVSDEIRRSALLELALVAQQANQPARAQQVYAQYVQVYPDDPSVPELLLRQGLLLREMGAHTNALNKFFGVLSSSLAVKYERLDYYRRLVLQAQTEIAETYYLHGKYADAVHNFRRLLKLDEPESNRPQLRLKLIRSLANLDRLSEVVAEAAEFLQAHSGQPEEPEVRYLLATTLKRLGRNQEAMQQVLLLLASPQLKRASKPELWLSWQQRTGNDIANQLYREGDFQGALQLYQGLAALDPTPAWELPALYQVGLVLERLKQPARAMETYARIMERGAAAETNSPNPGLGVILDMAKWRRGYLAWQTNAEVAGREFRLPPSSTNHLATLDVGAH